MSGHELSSVRTHPSPPAGAAPVEERRRQDRSHIRLPLRLTVASVDQVFETEALNISKGGMFIATEAMPPVGAEVDVEIALQSGTLLFHATGTVVRQQTYGAPRGIAVRLGDVSYEAQALIDRMLRDERLFGGYRIEEMIGRGGMAEVYRARVLEGPHAGRHAAIKRILPAYAAEPHIVRLFEKEARIAASLRHPNIVEVFDAGRVGATCFIAMEYVDGCNLSAVLSACQRRDIYLPVDFACYVVKTVADALHAVHTSTGPDGQPLGIVHRDVAPGNVFISHRGEVKLGDFGVAAVRGERASIAGKDPYMAPETILAGRSAPASDVFSLGAVLYEMLTNRRAFGGATPGDTRRAIVTGALVPPRALRPELSPEIEELVLRALSPRRARANRMALRARWRELRAGRFPERFSDAAEMSAALERLYDPAVGTELAIATVVRHLGAPG